MKKFKKFIPLGAIGVLGFFALCFCLFGLPNFNSGNLQSPNEATSNIANNTQAPNEPYTETTEAASNSSNLSNYIHNNYVTNYAATKSATNNDNTPSNNNAAKADNSSNNNAVDLEAIKEGRVANLLSDVEANKTPMQANLGFTFNNDNADEDLSYQIDGDTLKIGGLEDYSNKFDSASAAPWVTDKDHPQYKIKKVEITDFISPKATIGWFGCMVDEITEQVRLSDIKSITGMDNLDMTNVENASFMFVGSDWIEEIDATDTFFNSITKVTNAEEMCNYTSLSNEFLNKMMKKVAPTVVNARLAFASNPNLANVDMGETSFSAATNLSYMFLYNNPDKTTLKTISADNALIKEEGTVDVSAMFGKCAALESINLGAGANWNRNGVTATDLFRNCSNLVATVGDKTFDYASHKETVDENPINYACACTSSQDGLFTCPPSSLKSLTIKETIGGSEQDVQYFPIAGDSLSDDVVFYDQNKREIKKTASNGTKYQQSDLGGKKEDGSIFYVANYVGDGAFKTLRSVRDSWDNTFYIDGEEEGEEIVYPHVATGVKDTFKVSKLVANKEQVVLLSNTGTPAYDGVNLADIWAAYKYLKPEVGPAVFGEENGDFWTNVAEDDALAYEYCSDSTDFNDGARYETESFSVLIERGINKYNVNVIAPGTGQGGTASASPTSAQAGETVTLTANPDEEYELDKWESADVEITGNTFTMPAHDVTITAKFKPKEYEIKFSINDGTGTAPSTIKAKKGDEITLPDNTGFTKDGVTFTGWNTTSTSDGDHYDAGASYTVTGNQLLWADWRIEITFANDNNGHVEDAEGKTVTSVIVDNQHFAYIEGASTPQEIKIKGIYGDYKYYKAVPNNNYRFKEWIGLPESSSHVVLLNTTVTASFELDSTIYTLTSSPASSATWKEDSTAKTTIEAIDTPTISGTNVNYTGTDGNSHTVTAAAASGYRLNNVTMDGTIITANCIKQITVKFAQSGGETISFTKTSVVVDASSTWSRSGNKVSFADGQTVTASTSVSYAENWSWNPSSTSGTLGTSDTTFYATVTIPTYTLTFQKELLDDDWSTTSYSVKKGTKIHWAYRTQGSNYRLYVQKQEVGATTWADISYVQRTDYGSNDTATVWFAGTSYSAGSDYTVNGATTISFQTTCTIPLTCNHKTPKWHKNSTSGTKVTSVTLKRGESYYYTITGSKTSSKKYIMLQTKDLSENITYYYCYSDTSDGQFFRSLKRVGPGDSLEQSKWFRIEYAPNTSNGLQAYYAS